MPLTVRDIIADARDEHPSFTRERHSQRGAVRYLSERHRSYYAKLADDLKDRLSQGQEVAAVITGQLVGVDAGGTPYTVATGEDGYAVAVGADLTPYLVGPVIASDPFADGFVLPADSLQILTIWATVTSGLKVPVNWLPVGRQAQYGTPVGLTATVSRFRLSPIKNPADAQTAWDEVTSVTVVYVPEPAEWDAADVETLDIELEIPTVYGHVLKWELAAWFARREVAMGNKFPRGLLELYTANAKAEREGVAGRMPLDHRVVKQHRLVRNR